MAPSTSTTATSQPELVDPSGTVRGWVGAIADGNDDGAIARTSTRSLDAVGGADGFREMDIELAEGWGTWGRADDIEAASVELPSVPGTAVVVLHGQVSQEGPPQESWAALPVVATAAGDRVEPFLDLGRVEVSPTSGSTIAPDASFDISAPAHTDRSFVLDGGPSLSAARLAAHEPLAPGLHALTVVLSNADGVSAQTFTYTVSA